jgi:L-2,4-diaminobutyrate decarboxylase
VWLHVDGAHGASALLSEKHRWRVKGIERARSIAWDPHKMMLMPLSAGMVLVRDGKDLERAFSQNAPYLFHGADSESELSPDLGKRSFQCSRRADALKVWVALQRLGVDGIGCIYDALCDSASSLSSELRQQKGMTVLNQPESNILVWQIAEIDGPTVAALRQEFNHSAGWITSTQIAGKPCLRVTMMNVRTQQEDIQRVVSEQKALQHLHAD